MEDEVLRLEAENSELRRQVAALQATLNERLERSIDTTLTPRQAIEQLRTIVSMLEQAVKDSDNPG